MAPDIGELKLFATALKMGTAFSTVDKRAKEWIEDGWSTKTLETLKTQAADSEGEYTYNELKNKYLDLKDDFERANRDLRGKLQRFEEDPYSQGASPILRYERIVDQFGVKGKLFLGLNSHQAKGYRIVELNFPRWLEELMKTDPDIFYSMNLSEGEVYALVPSRGIDQEKLSVLRNDFWEDMEKAGVPAFDTFRGYKELKPEFSSRLEKTIDKRYPFDTNVLRIQALEEAIKREHALAIPITRAIATGSPILPPMPKPVEAAKRLAPKFAKNQEVRYQGATYLILDLAFQNGEWLYELNAPGVSLFKPEKEIQKLLEQPLLSIYTVQGVRFVEGFEESGAAFRKADEMRRQFPGSVYRVVKPDVLQHKWHPFEVWLVNRGYEVPEKIRVAEPIKTVSTPLYTTAHVVAAEESRFEKNIPLMEKELTTSSRDPAAIIFNYGFTFEDDIKELYAYAKKTNHPIVLRAMEKAFPKYFTPKYEMPPYFKDRAHDYFLISAKNYQLKDVAKYEPEFNKTYDSTKTFEQNVVLINTLLESIYQREKAAATQKFKVGDRVLWKGKVYKIEMTEVFDGVFRYRFFTDEGYAMAREEDLAAAPSEEEVKEEAKLEKEAEEERELKEEPEQTVYVKVIVEGGVPANDQGEMKIETPQFTLTATTYEELAKYGNEWGNDNMWSRPIVGIYGVKQLIEVLKDAEIEYDAIEDMGLTWGTDWDAIREALADNPAPFNKYALFHIKWRPEDLMFTQAAADTHDVYMKRYTKEELLHESKRGLSVIAKVKDLPTGGEVGELIDRIVAFNPETAGEPEEFPNLVEQPQVSSWKKGMPLTDDQIEQAKYDAIMHVAEEDIPRIVMMVYNQQGKDAALRVLKEKIMNWGQGGPDEPDLRGTPKGVEVSNAIMNPTDVRIISFPDLLDYIIRWDQAKAEAYNKPSVAPIAPPVAKPTPTVPLEKPAAVTAPTVVPKVTQPPAPAPRPTKILSSEDMRLLQDYWNTQFIRAIGKVPAGFSSVFRIEFQEVKTLPFAEAKNAILAAADREIERIEQEQRARVTIRQGERIGPGQPAKKTPTQRTPMTDKELEEENEEGFRVPVGGRVPPSFFPPNPLSVEQPFPRGPTSLEQLRLWQVFCFEMQTEGYDCNQYAREFTEYINKTQFYDWEDLKENFEFFVNTVSEGATLPPIVQWRKELTVPKGIGGELRELEPSPEPAKLTHEQIEMEERNAVKRQRILIAQKAAGLISYNGYYVGRKQKTLHDLYVEMTSRGVIDASIPEEIFLPVAKEAIREIYHEPLYTEEWIPIDGEEELTEKLNIGRSAFGKMTERQVENFLAT